MYEELASVSDVPDLAVALVDYDDHANLGRHVLFHRACASHDPRIEAADVAQNATGAAMTRTWRRGGCWTGRLSVS
ncbi:hypothetical protein BCY88_18840 [Paraburkholderia fungorum]|uniref:Uncharacterized protein n=1 Tax=Paraburkholderia fungorum TaxID=134537 RepID=A0A3R7IC25_9BURK|nr:hypothetical protein BCY88_18840 [Paraburkholderia fungorum]